MKDISALFTKIHFSLQESKIWDRNYLDILYWMLNFYLSLRIHSYCNNLRYLYNVHSTVFFPVILGIIYIFFPVSLLERHSFPGLYRTLYKTFQKHTGEYVFLLLKYSFI